MEIQQLRYFVALAHERHFVRAAEHSHVSQPTLSQQIQKLERELKITLFDRTPRKVQLTADGKRFLPHALAILEALERAQHEMAAPGSQLAGPIQLGAIPTMAPYLLPGVAKALRQEAPEVTLNFRDEPTAALLRYLQDGRIDLAILSLPIEEPGIATRSLGQEPMYVALSRHHPLSSQKAIRPGMLEQERLLVLQEGHCFRDQSLDFCRRTRVQPHVVFHGSSLTSVLRMAAAGEGITFVPRMAANPKEHPDLVFLPFKPPIPMRDIAVAWRQRLPLRPVQSLLIDLIQRTVSTL